MQESRNPRPVKAGENLRRSSGEVTANPYLSLSTLIKTTQADDNWSRFFTVKQTPERMPLTYVFLAIDESAVRHIAARTYTDAELVEYVSSDTKTLHGFNTSYWMLRKRLWSLRLRHLIYRDTTMRYHLHTKYETAIREIIGREAR